MSRLVRFAFVIVLLSFGVVPAASASSYFECKLTAVVGSVGGEVLAPCSSQESRKVTLTFETTRDGHERPCAVEGPLSVPLTSGEPGKLAGLVKGARIAVTHAIIFPSRSPD